MPLTDREKRTLQDIRDWEHTLINYEATDLEATVEKYLEQSFSLLPELTQQQFFSLIDTWLFHLNGIIQGSQLQTEAKNRILSLGRTIGTPDIEEIQDLRKLTLDQVQYIAEQQVTRHRMYSLFQGGLSGTGNALLLGADIPAMAVINLKVVQLIAMSFGVDTRIPFEMMTSLKVFHTATLPRRLQKQGWFSLMEELKDGEHAYFYEGKEELTDISWLEQPIKQMMKSITLIYFKNKKIQGIPLLGMAVGAAVNYRLTRKVTELAMKYYQLRYLKAKEE
ncbi:EcsC family protein [Neobacillus dielmonensis]|uniref:EcsC family protein n=1 Tax=Neobacillus dielmonensis TaxID=1347369 RepID=UPI0005A66FEB|nr:EcsC family protein [Neobacillus dielmonensis]